MTISPQNIQWPQSTNFVTLDRGTMALGVKDVSPFIPDTLTGSENFETDPISGAGTWTLTASSPHTGARCLRSGVIANNGITDYVFNVPVGTNFINFWYRVSTELNFDFFRVYKDAIIPGNLLLQASGTANVWIQSQFNIAGAATITFRYIKDGSSAGGLDTSFIDDIEWIGTLGQAAVQVYEPFHLNTSNCTKVTVCDPIIITGEVEIRPLDCVIDSVTICPGEDPIEVTVNNFPAVAHLDCVTDSVTICPGDDPIEVTVNNFPANVPLDCATDSVTICPGEDPIEVTVNNFPANVPLDCATDSVTICPGEDPIEVTVNNFPTVAHLDCATDSVGACQEGDWTVGIEGEVDVNVVGGTITMVPGRRTLTGLYYATGGPFAYTTAADTATGGEIWLVNTSASVLVYLRSVRFTVMLNSLALLTNLPIIRMERMTFTGTPSGGQITPAKRDSNDATNTGTIRTASTGMTPTAGAAIHSFAPPSADVIGGLLAVNATASIPVEQLFEADLDSYIVLRQNQGIVIRQSSAGNATENRTYWLNIVWEEI